MDPLFEALPETLAELDDERLQAWIDTAQARVEEIAASPNEFVTEERDLDTLFAELETAVESIATARVELKSRVEAAAAETTEGGGEGEGEGDGEDTAAERFAALAAKARGENDDDEEETVEETEETEETVVAAADDPEEDEPEAVEEKETEVVTAAAKVDKPKTTTGKVMRLGRPSRSRASAPPAEEKRVALTASAEGLGYPLGGELPSAEAMAEMMISRRGRFGTIPEGTHGDQLPIARFEYGDMYPEDRRLFDDEVANWDKITAAINQTQIKKELEHRREKSLVASGGLCAPVTPYYQLAMISVPDRPVRAALPAFNADRGGIKYARPAALSAITTAVGTKTAAEDAAGGSEAAKTCQVVDCPPFQETDVEIIYHCLQFGNLGARTFPERVAQWNALVLAAHARTAESLLLTGIETASTAVTAADIGLGASASLLTEILVAAQSIRSRNRMSTDAVLRLMMPFWAPSLMVSDVIRSQFQRFDTDEARITALLRSFNVEPTWYMDGADNASQVFGTQNAGALLPYPATVHSYLFPEGSFLYVDGGVLELGLVRDSVLNKTNDFQIFGESFENVAFVGVESYSLISTVCDTGQVSVAATFSECGDYGTS